MDQTTSLLLATAIVTCLAAAAAAADRSENVGLESNGHTVSRSGTLNGHDTISYVFNREKGEKLRVNFVSTRGSCRFDLYAPGMAVPTFRGVAPASAFSGSLPGSGNHRVKVLMDPPAGESCSFNVTFRRNR